MGQLHHKALRYGTRFQAIVQFYLPYTRLSTNGMNHTCLCLSRQSWSSFTDPGGMEGWVGLGTTMASKQSAQEVTNISCSDSHALPATRNAASHERRIHDLSKAATQTQYATDSPHCSIYNDL